MTNIKFIIIAAVSVDGVIGIDNEIPWRIPEDFRHFRNTTIGNMLLVGYNTFHLLPPKAFEEREYMVVCGDNPVTDHSSSVYQFHDLSTILDLLNDEKTDIPKVFVAGGAMIYDSMIDYCDECIITWVNNLYPKGNKRFPIDKLFANFVPYDDWNFQNTNDNWQKSSNGMLYKITHYRKLVDLNSKK